MLPAPAPSPVPSPAPRRARDDSELCTSGSEREWDDLIAAFPLPVPEGRSSPVPRPRSATISAGLMRNDARRAEGVSSPSGGDRSEGPLAMAASPDVNEAVTPPFVFASIRPSLTTPPVSPAPPTTQYVAAVGELVAPHPRHATPTVVHLEETVAAGPSVSTARKGKKRARIDSTSPSPASAARFQPPSRAPTTPSQRAQLPPALRPTIGPSGWATPETSMGRLAPATAELIKAVLRPIPGSELLAPGGRTAPTRTPAARPPQPVASSSRTRSHDENVDPNAPQPNHDMDIDLHLEFNQAALRSHESYGLPLQPVDINRLRFPEAFQYMGPLAEETGAYEDPPLMDVYNDHTPRGVLSVRDRPPTPHPLRSLSSESSTSTPARTVSHSAAALAASFVASQPIPIPGTANANAQNAAVTTYRAAPRQLAPGAMGGHLFTNVPPGGFPVIYRADPDGLFAGLSQARGVALREQNALIATVHNLGFPNRFEVRPAVAAMASVVRQVSGDLNPLIVAPVRDWSPANARQVEPVTFGIIGLTVEGALRVLARTTWSTQAITIHVTRAAIATSRFMFTIGEFDHDHNGSILDSVFAVFSGPVVLPLIVHYVRTHPDYVGVREDVAARAILASLEVRVSPTNTGSLMAAVFCDPPTIVPSRWSEWRARVANLPFTHPLNSTGVVHRIPPCEGCHGEDHTTNSCPFQDVVGWNAPPPGTTWAQPGYGMDQAATATLPPPPPPPPAGGSSASRGRAHSGRRGGNPNMHNASKRDYQSGGPGNGNGAGPSRGGGGYGGGRGGAGAMAF